MPVTLVLSSIRTELRLGGGGSGGSHEDEIATRLLQWATDTISEHLGVNYATTPTSIVNQACIRLCAWTFDVPTAGGGSRYANALRSSGAERLLLPYVSHSAGLPDAA